MKVNRTDLLGALTLVKPGLANVEVIDQATNFVFTDGWIYTFNDEITVRTPFDMGGLKIAVPSKELLAFLSRTVVDELNVVYEENQLKLSAARIRTGIHAQCEIQLPFKMVEMPTAWLDLPKGFEEGILMTLGSIGKDTSQPALEGIHLDANVMESSDNYRLTIFEMEGVWDGETIIPGTSMKMLLSHNPVSYAIGEDWVHFLNEKGAIFSCRPLAGVVFPPMDAHLDVEGGCVEFPAELEQALSDAEVFINPQEEWWVSVHVGKNQLTVKGEGDIGWLEEMVRMKYDGKPAAFKINPTYFRQILGKLNKVTIGERSIKFTDDPIRCAHVLSLETI